MNLLTKFYGYLAAAGALVLAVVSALLYGRYKGAKEAKQADAVASAEQTIHAHEVRHEVEAEVQKLPDAPTQKVADAAPATAAGKLRDDGWLRD